MNKETARVLHLFVPHVYMMYCSCAHMLEFYVQPEVELHSNDSDMHALAQARPTMFSPN